MAFFNACLDHGAIGATVLLLTLLLVAVSAVLWRSVSLMAKVVNENTKSHEMIHKSFEIIHNSLETSQQLIISILNKL